jgi:hypothetical protein
MLFSDIVMEQALDGDLQTKMSVIEYSTSPREVVTVGDMQQRFTMLFVKGDE